MLPRSTSVRMQHSCPISDEDWAIMLRLKRAGRIAFVNQNTSRDHEDHLRTFDLALDRLDYDMTLAERAAMGEKV